MTHRLCYPLLIAVCIGGLGLSRPARGAIINVSADAKVQGGANLETEFGNDAILDIKRDSGNQDFTRKGYFRFDLSSISGVVSTASFQLTLNGSSGGSDPGTPENWNFLVYGLRDDFSPGAGVLGNNWAELAINGNNAPGNIPAGQMIDESAMFGAAPLGSFIVVGAGTAGATVSISGSALVEFLNSDTDDFATLVLVRETASFGVDPNVHSLVHHFRSLQAPSGGAALLDFTVVPEPATAWMFAGSLVAAAWAVRRRRAA